jgi:chemotaxis protein methyltransferase CheR
LTAASREQLARLAESRLGLAVSPVYESRLTQALAGASHALAAASDDAALTALARLPDEADAWQRVIQSLTVGETRFLRQRDWFARIEAEALAPLVRSRQAAGPRRLRVWSAGCATGEEPYTIAMLVDALLPDRAGWDVQILGTDINAAFLAVADAGVYRPWALREIEPALRARCFVEIRPKRFRVTPAIRSLVSFRKFNLVSDPCPDPAAGIGGFDLVLCRNVMIYLTVDQQDAVAAKLTRSLAPGGWLAVAPTEATAARFRPLTLVSFPNAILFRAATGTARADAPSRPRKSVSAAPAGGRRAKAPSDRPTARRTAAAGRHPHLPSAATAVSAAQALADGGRLAEARERCVAALAQDAMSVEANLLLATICAEMGDAAAALEAARRAAYLRPDSAAAHFLMGTALRRLGNVRQSRRSMAAVVRLLEAEPADAAVGLGAEATAGTLRAAASACLAAPPERQS